MIRMIRGSYLPSVTLHFRTPGSSDALEAVAPFTRTMTAQDGKTTAYVCSGRTCSAPVTDPEALLEAAWRKKVKALSEVLERDDILYPGKFPDQGPLFLGNGNRCIHGGMAERGKDVAGKVPFHDQVHEFFTDELLLD